MYDALFVNKEDEEDEEVEDSPMMFQTKVKENAKVHDLLWRKKISQKALPLNYAAVLQEDRRNQEPIKKQVKKEK